MVTWMLPVCLILLLSIMLGRIAEKAGQSRVVGEIATGLLLGTSVLGDLFPEVHAVIFFSKSLDNLEVLADLGLVLLMFEVVWHASVIRADQGRSVRLVSLIITLFGVSFAFLIGSLVAIMSKESMAHDKAYWPYVLFCGLALSVTALPVLIRIIADSKNITPITVSYALSSAIYTDVFAWVGIAFLMAFNSTDEKNFIEPVTRILMFFGFCGVSIYVIRPLISRLYRTSPTEGGKGIQLTVVLCYCLVCAEITYKLGFHQAIGVVVAAYVFRKVPGLEGNWISIVGGFARVFFIPLFFAYSGLKVNFGYLSESSAWLWLGVFVVGGFLGKVGGVYLGGRLCGLSPIVSMEVGLLMNTKGLVELVILSIGLELGVLSEKAYSILIIVALLSIVMALPLLRLFAKLCSAGTSVELKAVEK